MKYAAYCMHPEGHLYTGNIYFIRLVWIRLNLGLEYYNTVDCLRQIDDWTYLNLFRRFSRSCLNYIWRHIPRRRRTFHFKRSASITLYNFSIIWFLVIMTEVPTWIQSSCPPVKLVSICAQFWLSLCQCLAWQMFHDKKLCFHAIETLLFVPSQIYFPQEWWERKMVMICAIQESNLLLSWSDFYNLTKSYYMMEFKISWKTILKWFGIRSIKDNNCCISFFIINATKRMESFLSSSITKIDHYFFTASEF